MTEITQWLPSMPPGLTAAGSSQVDPSKSIDFMSFIDASASLSQSWPVANAVPPNLADAGALLQGVARESGRADPERAPKLRSRILSKDISSEATKRQATEGLRSETIATPGPVVERRAVSEGREASRTAGAAATEMLHSSAPQHPESLPAQPAEQALTPFDEAAIAPVRLPVPENPPAPARYPAPDALRMLTGSGAERFLEARGSDGGAALSKDAGTDMGRDFLPTPTVGAFNPATTLPLTVVGASPGAGSTADTGHGSTAGAPSIATGRKASAPAMIGLTRTVAAWRATPPAPASIPGDSPTGAPGPTGIRHLIAGAVPTDRANDPQMSGRAGPILPEGYSDRDANDAASSDATSSTFRAGAVDPGRSAQGWPDAVEQGPRLASDEPEMAHAAGSENQPTFSRALMGRAVPEGAAALPTRRLTSGIPDPMNAAVTFTPIAAQPGHDPAESAGLEAAMPKPSRGGVLPSPQPRNIPTALPGKDATGANLPDPAGAGGQFTGDATGTVKPSAPAEPDAEPAQAIRAGADAHQDGRGPETAAGTQTATLPPAMPAGWPQTEWLALSAIATGSETGTPERAPTLSIPAPLAPVIHHLPVPIHDLPRVIGSQGASPSGVTELSLAPEELGRLRMQMAPDGDSIRIVLSAERPETLDLLRRNVEQLAADLRQMGFASSSFSFSGWGGRPPVAPPAAPAEGPATSDAAVNLAASTVHPTPASALPQGLDLRL